MNLLADELLKYYFDLCRNPEDTFLDETYVSEEIERISTLLLNLEQEEQQLVKASALTWLAFFKNNKNNETHPLIRKSELDFYDMEFLEYVAYGHAMQPDESPDYNE